MNQNISRSKELCIVALYLSKFGQVINNKTFPPKELNISSWIEAYRMFYKKLGGGRSIRSFENTLKHTRDEFDSHLTNTLRIGWLNSDGSPKTLTRNAKEVFENYSSKNQNELWSEIKKYSNLDIKEYAQEFEDLASIQDSESELSPKQKFNSRTEGGKKVIISYRYERDPKLKKQALVIHGYDCMVCGFNFEKKYGGWGKDFAEVHHLIPMNQSGNKKRKTNPKTDLAVLCANCHRMVHRKKNTTLTIDELKQKIVK